jgi:hypothetical protein
MCARTPAKIPLTGLLFLFSPPLQPRCHRVREGLGAGRAVRTFLTHVVQEGATLAKGLYVWVYECRVCGEAGVYLCTTVCGHMQSSL